MPERNKYDREQGSRLREAREYTGLSRTEFAGELSPFHDRYSGDRHVLDEAQVARWERGAGIRPENKAMIERFFDDWEQRHPVPVTRRQLLFGGTVAGFVFGLNRPTSSDLALLAEQYQAETQSLLGDLCNLHYHGVVEVVDLRRRDPALHDRLRDETRRAVRVVDGLMSRLFLYLPEERDRDAVGRLRDALQLLAARTYPESGEPAPRYGDGDDNLHGLWHDANEKRARAHEVLRVRVAQERGAATRLT